MFLQKDTQNLIDAGEQPDNYGLVAWSHVDIDRVCHRERRSVKIEPCIDVDQQEHMKRVNAGVSVGMGRQDAMLPGLVLIYLLPWLLLEAAFLNGDQHLQQELCAIVDDLKTEGNQQVPELYLGHVETENSPVLQASEEERQL